MGLPSLNIRIAVQRATACNISLTTLAALCDLSAASLSQANRGQINLTGPNEQKVSEVALKLSTLSEAVRPLSLPTDVDGLRMILDFVNENGVDVERIRGTIGTWFGARQ